MKNTVCETLGIDFPLFAFSHCRDVVVAVSRAGGFGVLGGTSFTPEGLEIELQWIDEHIGGKPYGVDILVPGRQDAARGARAEDLAARVPDAHRQFLVDLLGRYQVGIDASETVAHRVPSVAPDIGEKLIETAFRHPIGLIINALGVAPPMMIEQARKQGIPVAALVGTREHAVRQVEAGVDILIAQGGEAGGHTGEIATLVLVPEVLRAIAPIRPVPVLAAGGIMTGRQMAACMALGAQGVWTGSVWLATIESETTEIFREKMIAATSRDTVRSKARTGKPSRQLRSAWHDAWEAPGNPGALPMPVMSMLCEPAFRRIDKAAEAGNPKARELVTYWVGQGVGLVDGIKSAGAVVQEFREEFADALTDMFDLVEDA